MSYQNKSKSSSSNQQVSSSRRKLLATLVGAIGAAATASAAKAADEESKASSSPSGQVPVGTANWNVLERLQQDLKRALAKPPEQRRWAMVIDLEKCIGCKACTASCQAENNLPPGVVYRPVIEEELGEFPNVRKRFIPRPCMHCDNPPCTPVCPVGATYKRVDGIVAIDYEVCIGCRYCLAACPYNARTSDFGEFFGNGTPQIMDYETRPVFEYGRIWKREPGKRNSPIGNAHKCHFCLHRVENGMLPACVTTCLGGATYFGDLHDPESLVAELACSPRVMRLKEELGTKPMTFYLM